MPTTISATGLLTHEEILLDRLTRLRGELAAATDLETFVDLQAQIAELAALIWKAARALATVEHRP